MEKVDHEVHLSPEDEAFWKKYGIVELIDSSLSKGLGVNVLHASGNMCKNPTPSKVFEHGLLSVGLPEGKGTCKNLFLEGKW
jgi:hypothetical protein